MIGPELITTENAPRLLPELINTTKSWRITEEQAEKIWNDLGL